MNALRIFLCLGLALAILPACDATSSQPLPAASADRVTVTLGQTRLLDLRVADGRVHFCQLPGADAAVCAPLPGNAYHPQASPIGFGQQTGALEEKKKDPSDPLAIVASAGGGGGGSSLSVDQPQSGGFVATPVGVQATSGGVQLGISSSSSFNAASVAVSQAALAPGGCNVVQGLCQFTVALAASLPVSVSMGQVVSMSQCESSLGEKLAKDPQSQLILQSQLMCKYIDMLTCMAPSLAKLMGSMTAALGGISGSTDPAAAKAQAEQAAAQAQAQAAAMQTCAQTSGLGAVMASPTK